MVDERGRKRSAAQIEAFVLARRKQEDLLLKKLRVDESQELKDTLLKQKQEHDKAVTALKSGAAEAKIKYQIEKEKTETAKHNAEAEKAAAEKATADAKIATADAMKAKAKADKATAEASRQKKEKKDKKEKKEKD